MEVRELCAFVAVVEEGGMSAAARRLHMSQSALSQTVQSLERQVGAQLLVRDHSGARATEVGQVLLGEARALIEHHERAMAAVTGAAGSVAGTAGLLRVGMPMEFPPDRLPAALARLGAQFPATRVELRHSSSAAQLADLRAGDLDVALVRDRPADTALDAVLAVREALGVVLAAEPARHLAHHGAGIALHRLSGLRWIGFPRADTPAWYDQVAATLRGHGIDVRDEHRPIIAEVKLAAVGAGGAFALAPSGWAATLPEGVVWQPLMGDPIVRRTWALWQADARQRDLAALIQALDTATGQ